jgi:HD-GYP domain-containing protein (c-di-GMP phosphodiesterase class II)
MDTQDSIALHLDALPEGYQLAHPLYGEQGVRFLLAGATITPRVKRILTDRGVERVRVHQEDAAALLAELARKKSSPNAQVDNDLCKQIDDMIDSGAFVPKEVGPAVRDSMLIHHRKAYDSEQREKFRSQHRKACHELNSMMQKIVQGDAVDGSEIRELAAAGMESITQDSEAAITVSSDADDKGISEQSIQTSLLGMAIAIEMGLDAESVRIISATGLVGDWGMIHLPAGIRGVKRQFNERERLEIQKVPVFTANILQEISGLPRWVLPVAYQIHEKADGTGYPKGRDASSIHLFAKILHVADLYTGLTAPGPNRRPAMPYAAMELIVKEANKASIDVDVARALLRVMSLFPIGSYVALGNGSVARVLRSNGEDYSHPVVQIVVGAGGNRVSPDNENAILVPSERHIEITRALPTPGRNELSSSEMLAL